MRKSKPIGNGEVITVDAHYDRYFSITAEITKGKRIICCGCMHDEIRKYFPELAHFIKWHLCDYKGPMHYIENTIYHATEIPAKQDKWFFYLENKLIKLVNKTEKEEMIQKYGDNCLFNDYPNSMAKPANLEAARESAIWPEATLEQLRDKNQLMDRLPVLLKEFADCMSML